jgi:hypothetical protein
MRKEFAVNAAHDSSKQDDSDLDYQAGTRRVEPSREPRRRRPQHIRTSRPAGFNGKHRRRNKRYMC